MIDRIKNLDQPRKTAATELFLNLISHKLFIASTKASTAESFLVKQLCLANNSIRK